VEPFQEGGPWGSPGSPIIDLAPSAEENPLSVELADLIRRNLAASPRKQVDFRALRGSVLMVAQDLGEALTLRFDHGRLTIHDGTVGIPSVTFCGDLSALRKLSDFPVTRWLRLPLLTPFSRQGRETWHHLARLFAKGELKVYGLAAHPRTLVFLLRILSVHG
jgi:hypothetical protein